MLTSKKALIPLVPMIALTSLGVNANETKFKIGPKITHHSGHTFGKDIKNSSALYGFSSELDVSLGGNIRLFPSLDIAVGKTTYKNSINNKKAHPKAAFAEVRLPIGYNFVQTPESTLTGFSGLGYRHLHEKIKNDGEAAIFTSQRTYVPIGLAYRATIAEKTALELRGEYDRLVQGKVKLKDDGTDVKGKSSGNGARLSATLEKELSSTTLFASASYQLWKVQHKNTQDASYKSNDTSHELGLTVGVAL